jgi:hypothetical protein
VAPAGRLSFCLKLRPIKKGWIVEAMNSTLHIYFFTGFPFQNVSLSNRNSMAPGVRSPNVESAH